MYRKCVVLNHSLKFILLCKKSYNYNFHISLQNAPTQNHVMSGDSLNTHLVSHGHKGSPIVIMFAWRKGLSGRCKLYKNVIYSM